LLRLLQPDPLLLVPVLLLLLLSQDEDFLYLVMEYLPGGDVMVSWQHHQYNCWHNVRCMA